ncbi:unnamed protein product [Calicophoron daubneyi]|uniref:Phosphatidylinositol 3,4,5-trisphosphate 3-phosphatase and dual-specificity protein phosphatase PTEN n=1 Tax=Calicophoron daubneyi TaxID=300641 RepID=A0AAV2TVR5_CALDB
MAMLRQLVSRRKKRFQEEGFDLDLSYISDRIIAMGFPAVNFESVYRNPLDDVVRFLQKRHPNHYKLYHLCDERDFDVCRFSGPVAKYPFPDHNAPQFEQMIALCDDVHNFLNKDKENIIAINCKAGKGRTGVMVCACLLRLGLVSNALDSLKLYGERRTDDGKGVTIPSQRRYVQYYDTYLSHNLVYSRTPLRLREVRVHGVHTQAGSTLNFKFRSYYKPPLVGSTCNNSDQDRAFCKVANTDSTEKLSDSNWKKSSTQSNRRRDSKSPLSRLMASNSSIRTFVPPEAAHTDLADQRAAYEEVGQELTPGDEPGPSASSSSSVAFSSSKPRLRRTRSAGKLQSSPPRPFSGMIPDPLVIVTNLSSSDHIKSDETIIYAPSGIVFAGDVCVKVCLHQHVLNKKVCRFWFNTFFVAHENLLQKGKTGFLNGSVTHKLKQSHPQFPAHTNPAHPTHSDLHLDQSHSGHGANNSNIEDRLQSHSPANYLRSCPKASPTAASVVKGRITSSLKSPSSLGLMRPDSPRNRGPWGPSPMVQDHRSSDRGLKQEVLLRLTRSEMDKVHKSKKDRILSHDFSITLVFSQVISPRRDISAGIGHTSRDRTLPAASLVQAQNENMVTSKSSSSPNHKAMSPTKGGLASLAAAFSMPFTRSRSARVTVNGPKELTANREESHANTLSPAQAPAPNFQPLSPSNVSPSAFMMSLAKGLQSHLNYDDTSEEEDEDEDDSASGTESDYEEPGRPVSPALSSVHSHSTGIQTTVLPSSSLSVGTLERARKQHTSANRRSRSLMHFSRYPSKQHPLDSNRSCPLLSNRSESSGSSHLHYSPVKHYFMKQPHQTRSPSHSDYLLN